MKRLTPFIWLAYLAVPVEGWGLFHGRPLDALGAAALTAACWLWWVRRSLPFPRVAVIALVAKIALGAPLVAPRGFDARYHANAEFAGPPEEGTEPADRSVTRIDRQLRFGGSDDDLPVYFFNDSNRFNFYRPNEPDRARLPVSATWEGWLRVARRGFHRVYVRPADARVEVTIGGGFSAGIPPSATAWFGYPNLEPGFQPIRISLSIPQGGARRFEAGWAVEGREEPFDTRVIFRRPMTAAALATDWLLRAVSTLFDLIVCGWLVVSILRAFGGAWHRLVGSATVADALKLAWAAAAVDALLFARPMLHKMVTLSGGDDWLSYETLARDIGLHGLWMTGGAALGHGAPFYFQPLYPYFVAATHWLFGDDLYGLYLVQRGLTAGTVIVLWRVTAALFGERVGWAGLLAATAIVFEKVGPWTGVVLNELLFVPALCLWALLLVKVVKSARPSLALAAGAGAVGGVATLTRSTLMLGWVTALPLLALSLSRTRRAGRIVLVLAAALVAVTSLATMRNWIVAHRFVLVSSSGSINLLIGNTPPKPVVVAAERRAAYERLGVDPNVQTVVEYARQSPRAFLDGWRRKAAYALGSFATLTPGAGRSTFYMGVSVVALIGVLLLIVRPAWLPAAMPASLIPVALALAHVAVLVIIFPATYGDRLLLPFYVLLVPYVSIVGFAAHRALWRAVGPKSGYLVLLMLAAACVWRFMRGAADVDVPLVTVAILLWALCVYGVPPLRASSAAVYGTLAIGLCIWAMVLGTTGAAHAVRLDGVFLAAAVASYAVMNRLPTFTLPETPGLAWLFAGITLAALVVLHVFGAGASLMAMAGLTLGAAESMRAPAGSSPRATH